MMIELREPGGNLWMSWAFRRIDGGSFKGHSPETRTFSSLIKEEAPLSCKGLSQLGTLVKPQSASS